MSKPRHRRTFFDHLHAQQIDARVLSPRLTLGLGVGCLATLCLLLLSGVTLLFYYVPDQRVAYERILHLSTTLRLGGLVRDLHLISANLLIVLGFLHLMRVFLTGSYKGRALNWLYGLGMLALILLGNFTGYLLPWDQVSYWAIKVAAGIAAYFPVVGSWISELILGGKDVGHETLIRAFAMHVAVVPGLMVFLTGLHLWRVRKDGGLALPKSHAVRKIPAVPSLYQAEAGIAMVVLALVAAGSLIWDAPIGARANPLSPPNPVKAPWYFVGFQELVGYSAFWGGVAAPVVLTLLFVGVPWLDRSPGGGGQWFQQERKWLNRLFLLLMACLVGLIVAGQWFRGKNWEWVNPF